MAGNIKRPRSTPKIRNEAQDQKTSKIKRAFRSDDAYRVEAKNGGCMQIKGFGKARRPKK